MLSTEQEKYKNSQNLKAMKSSLRELLGNQKSRSYLITMGTPYFFVTIWFTNTAADRNEDEFSIKMISFYFRIFHTSFLRFNQTECLKLDKKHSVSRHFHDYFSGINHVINLTISTKAETTSLKHVKTIKCLQFRF